MLVEYQLPLTSKRADVVLCGTHPKRGVPQYVVVELKQWSRAHLLEESDDVCVLEGWARGCTRSSRCAATAATCATSPPR